MATTTERARAEGVAASVAVTLVLEAIERRPAGAAVIAMNARYDLTVLHREAARHGRQPLTERRDLHVIDPRVIDLHLDKFRPGRRTLSDLCEHYGARIDAAHDAAADAIAAARVAWRIGTSGDVIRRVRDHTEAKELVALRREWDLVRHDLPALHDAQIRWAAEQAAGLEAHFRKKGKPGLVDREWPVITGRLV